MSSKQIPIAINGSHGRIAKHLIRLATGNPLFAQFQIVAVNDAAGNAVSLKQSIRHDSVHGFFEGVSRKGTDTLLVRDQEIQVLTQPDVTKIDWRSLGARYVIDATGRFTNVSDAKRHLESGAEKVLITAPLKGSDPDVPSLTTVFGVHGDLAKGHLVVSAASCTTNSVVLPLQALWELGVEEAFVDTVHASTNTDFVVDGARGRSALGNIRIETTGAAKTAGSVLHMLDGAFDGLSHRVPTPDGSLSLLTVSIKREISRDDVQQALKAAAEGSLRESMAFEDLDSDGDPIDLVSSDILGRTEGAVIAGLHTKVMPRACIAKVYSWYDNETGYSAQALRVLERMHELDMA
jgi:glyceraldehyde 3-phosphate dehydrogenase